MKDSESIEDMCKLKVTHNSLCFIRNSQKKWRNSSNDIVFFFDLLQVSEQLETKQYLLTNDAIDTHHLTIDI